MTAPAGWYPHPKRDDMEQFWDGAAWTAQIRSRGVGTDSLPVSAAVTTRVPVSPPRAVAQSIVTVVSVGGWPALFGGHSEVKTITRAVTDLNSRGLRVVAVTPDRWGFFTRLWKAFIAVVSLGFVVRKPNTLLICEPA